LLAGVIRILMLFWLAGPLAGCVSPYTPPTVSTSLLNVTMHNLFGEATLDIASPSGHLLGRQRILDNLSPRPAATTTIAVAAGQPVRLSYRELFGGGQCNLQFMFSVEPGQTYDVYIGDVSGPPPKTHLGQLHQFLFPASGRGCFTRVHQMLPGGGVVDVVLKKWTPVY